MTAIAAARIALGHAVVEHPRRPVLRTVTPFSRRVTWQQGNTAKQERTLPSKHIATLAEAGYVEQRRAVRDTRQRVWLHLTAEGHTAYRGHVAALEAIIGSR